jgi:chemotaxis protein MotA
VDLATIGGLIGGLGLIIGAIVAGGSLGMFVDVPSILTVIGGATAAIFVNFPSSKLLGIAKVLRKALFFDAEDPIAIIQKMVSYAERARKEGMLALEEDSESEPDKFLAKGLRLAVDGTDPQLLSRIMETDLAALETRHKEGKAIFEQLGAFAPAFGMIGTLIGLVQMLANLSDPSSIGAGMAVALLTTFYGSIIANLVALPIAGKLKARSEEELHTREMIIEGIMSIQSGDSPRIVQEKLKSYLTPVQQGALVAK